MSLLLAAALAEVSSLTAPDIQSAVASPGRPAPYVALDQHRRPVEILTFLGLKRGDRVLDYEAGGGYYAENHRQGGRS